MSMYDACIVGIDKTPTGKSYRLVIYKYNPNTGKWDFNTTQASEAMVIKSIIGNKLNIKNAMLDGTKLKGKTGSFSRFNLDKIHNIHPMVIISEIYSEPPKEKLLGYRVATYNGTVRTVKLSEMLIFCDKVTKSNVDGAVPIFPIQNAIYVEATETTSAHIKGFEAEQFIKEYFRSNRPKNVAAATVKTVENSKNLSKIEELFTKDQIAELRLGKQNGVDIRYYGNNKLSAAQMREIRKALENGVNPRLFADPAFKPETMRAYRIQAKYGVDIGKFINPEYNAEQIFELSTAVLSGVDLAKIADPKKSAHEMSKIRIELDSKLWKETSVSVIDLISTLDLDEE